MMNRWIALLLMVIAFLLQSPSVILVASYVYCLGFLFSDFKHLQLQRLDLSTMFAGGLLLNTIAHTIALSVTDAVSIRYFLLLYKPQFLFEGLAVFHLGSFIILESIRYYSRQNLKDISLSAQTLGWGQVLLASVFFFILPKYVSLASAGTIGSAVNLLVLGSLLLLSFKSHKDQHAFQINLCLLYTFFLSFYAYRTSYLRYEIIVPWFAYFFGELLARKRLLSFSAQSKFVAAALIIIIPPLFTYLGKTRATESLASRDLSVVANRLTSSQDEGGETVFSRLSFINQVTNIVNLTRQKGFYEGRTLEYYTYAFIPRFLWPEKPTIAQGQWFALEAGLAYKSRKGKINNSINMTVPGEFYLNFGWPGVIVGCWVFGLFFAFMWNRIQGLSLADWTFRFLLLFGAIAGLGADLQVIVTFTAYFLLYLFYTWSTRMLGYR